MDEAKKVEEFHKKFGHPAAENPTFIPKERSDLRYRLILEELNEYKKAVEENDMIEICDAIVDILYFTYGTAVEHGITNIVEEIFDEVQRSNMSKLGEDGKPIYREDGKIMKGPNYFKPNIKKILEKTN